MAEHPWRLDGRVALVTGASSGLGERFARVLHGAGAHVVVTARRGHLLEALQSSCGDGLEVAPGDIADPRHRRALVSHVEAGHGRLDILVNNAGAADSGALEEQSMADLTRVIDVNLTSVLDLCRLAAPMLLAAPSASVVNVASIFGTVGSRSAMAGYNATKGALVNLSRHLAAQWGDRGVRVNALAPGYFPTDLTGHLSDPTFARSVADRTLLGRLPRIDELDGPLLFLASDASSYVTGHTLLVDGGWTAV